MLAQDGQGHGLQEFQFADDTVAASPAARAAGAATDGEAPQPYRIAKFQLLGIGDAGIGHVGMYRRAATKARPGTRPAADGFVIAKMGIAKEEIIHGALATSSKPEGFE